MRQAILELQLPNVSVVSERVESYQPEAPFDVITSRAFAELGEFIKLTRHLLAEGGYWAALKGVYPYEEIALLPKDVVAGEVITLKVPGVDAERCLVMIKEQGSL